MFTYQRNLFSLSFDEKYIRRKRSLLIPLFAHTKKIFFPKKSSLLKIWFEDERTNVRTNNLSFVSNLFANKLYYINFNFIFLKRKKKLKKLAFSLRDFVLLLKSRKKWSNKNLAFFIVNKVSPIKNHVCFTLKCSSKSLS
jgi:hypothetical protein